MQQEPFVSVQRFVGSSDHVQSDVLGPLSYKQKGCMNAYHMRLYLRLLLQSLLSTGRTEIKSKGRSRRDLVAAELQTTQVVALYPQLAALWHSRGRPAMDGGGQKAQRKPLFRRLHLALQPSQSWPEVVRGFTTVVRPFRGSTQAIGMASALAAITQGQKAQANSPQCSVKEAL